MDYCEMLPDRDLGRRVSCFWLASVPDAPAPVMPKTILPDGCADFLFDLQALEQGRTGSHIIGTMTEALETSLEPGQRLFGIRFRPGGMRDLISEPLKELRDQRVELHELGIFADDLAEQLLAASDAAQMRACTQVWLRRRSTTKLDALIHHAVRTIEAGAADLRVQRLAQELGVSRQHLARRFADQVGLSPKELQRILRLQRCLSLLRAEARPSLTEVALRSGYCDQAHMNLEFRALTGASPGRLAS